MIRTRQQVKLPGARSLRLLAAAFLACIVLSASAVEQSETNTFTGINMPIPDGVAAGVHDVRTISSDIIFITSVRVRLNLSGNFNGDLYGYVRHSSGLSVLLNRLGRTAASQFGYRDTGLDVTFADSGSGDIHNYRSTVTPSYGSPLTGTWQPDARNVHPSAVSDISTRSAFLGALNGLSAEGTWTLFLADMDSGGTNVLNSWALEITGSARITPTITWTNPADIVYGTALSATQLNATASVPGTFVYNPPAASVLSAGSNTLSVTFTPIDTSVYHITTTNVSLNVLRKDIAVTVDNQTRIYAATNPAFSGTLTGLENGDNITASYSTLADVATPVGSYAIFPVFSDPDVQLGNYSVITNIGTLTITPASLTVTADNQSRTYGAANPTLTGTISSLQNADNINASYSTVADASSPVSSYDIIPTLNDPDTKLGNYNVTTNHGTLTINPATLTVTADHQTRSYGATNPSLTATMSGFVNGETHATVVTGEPGLSTTATTASPVGNYPITATPGSLSAANYTLSFVEGTLTVQPALLTGMADSKSRVYGETNPVFTVTYSGFVNGEDASIATGTLSGTTPAEINSPVGTYPISVSGQSAPNYTIQYEDGTITIVAAALLVQADDSSRAYGQSNPEFTTTFTGFVNGEERNALGGELSLSTLAETNSPVGTYAITPAGLTSTNYAITYSNGTMTVTAYALAVRADDQARTYGQTNPIFTGQFIGVQNGDNITASYSTFAMSNSPAGNYEIVPTLNDPDGKLTNYTVTITNGTLTVSPATVTITAADASKAYGAPLPNFAATYTGFALGEDTNSLFTLAALNTTAAATSNFGVYPITASGASSSNYIFSYVDGTLTITQALTTVTVQSSANPALHGSNVTFTATVGVSPPDAGTPSGTITFQIDGEPVGSNTLSDGVAAFTITNLDVGTHAITAEYASSLNFVGATNTLSPDQEINEPPSEGGDLLERYPTQGIKVRVTTLEANDPHPTNDFFKIASVSETSVAGATIKLHDGWVFYEPPPNFSNADSFTYFATNSAGTTVTMAVTVNPRADSDPSQNLRSIQLLGNGNRRAEFQGIPGRTYTVQYTQNLDAPDWQTLGASQADITGGLEFLDTPPTNSLTRFYRVIYP